MRRSSTPSAASDKGCAHITRAKSNAEPTAAGESERTTLSAGPAMLSLRTGAPILPVAVYYRDDMHRGVVRPRIPFERSGRLRDDVASLTQLVADELEALIRKAPEQWHLMQPNWPSDRE